MNSGGVCQCLLGFLPLQVPEDGNWPMPHCVLLTPVRITHSLWEFGMWKGFGGYYDSSLTVLDSFLLRL